MNQESDMAYSIWDEFMATIGAVFNNMGGGGASYTGTNLSGGYGTIAGSTGTGTVQVSYSPSLPTKSSDMSVTIQDGSMIIVTIRPTTEPSPLPNRAIVDPVLGVILIHDNKDAPAAPNGGTGNVIQQGYMIFDYGSGQGLAVKMITGTSSNDLLQGGGWMLGGDGNDTLIGSDGNDYLVAGTGNNILRGGKGADKLDGTGGWGVADYHHAATAVKVYLDGSKANVGDEAEGDTFVNINGVQGSAFADELNGNGNDNWMIGDGGNDTVKGGDGNDTLYGSSGDDQLIGGAGNDHLIGGVGNNVLEGGDGADVLDGSDGWGVADYRHADTAVTVRLDGSGNAGDEAAGDTYINVNGAFGSAFGDTILGNANGNWIIACEGNDTVSGGVGSDTLYGSEGDDVLNGGSDNDTLFGGSGSNVLTGGSGRDVYVFDAPGSLSRITDFSVAEDKLQLDRGVFSGFGASVSLAVGSMANSGGAQIIYNSGTGDLSYDADGLGGGVAVKFALLATGLALTANNFIL